MIHFPDNRHSGMTSPTTIREANAMQEKGLTINDLIVRVQEAMREGGYSISAVYAKYGHWFNVISTYYRKIGRIYHESDVTAECVALQAKRKERGEISDHYFRHLGYAAHRLDEYFMTEKIRIINVMHGTKFVLNEQNERLVDQFVIWKKYGENTVNDAIWVVRRYLYYFEQKGYNSLETVSIEDVRQYILSTAAELKISSLYNILLYLKYLEIFALRKDMVLSNISHEFVVNPDFLFLLAVHDLLLADLYMVDEAKNGLPVQGLQIPVLTDQIGPRLNVVTVSGCTFHLLFQFLQLAVFFISL